MHMMWFLAIATFILFSLLIYFLSFCFRWFFSSNVRTAIFSFAMFVCLMAVYGIYKMNENESQENLIFIVLGISIPLFLSLSYVIYVTIKNKNYYDKHFEGKYYYELPAEYTPAEMSVLFMKQGLKDLAATLLDLVRKKIISITFVQKNDDYKYKIELTDNAIEINEPVSGLDIKTSIKKEKELNLDKLHLMVSMAAKHLTKECKDSTSLLELIKRGIIKKGKDIYSGYKIYKNLKPHENYLINWFINEIGDSKKVYLSDIADQAKFCNYSFIEHYNDWLRELKLTANENNNFFRQHVPFIFYGE